MPHCSINIKLTTGFERPGAITLWREIKVKREYFTQVHKSINFSHTYTHIFTHAHTHIYTHAHTHIYTLAHTQCTHTHAHTDMHTQTCTHTHTHMHTYAHTYAHILTHTHLPWLTIEVGYPSDQVAEGSLRKWDLIITEPLQQSGRSSSPHKHEIHLRGLHHTCMHGSVQFKQCSLSLPLSTFNSQGSDSQEQKITQSDII